MYLFTHIIIHIHVHTLTSYMSFYALLIREPLTTRYVLRIHTLHTLSSYDCHFYIIIPHALFCTVMLLTTPPVVATE